MPNNKWRTTGVPQWTFEWRPGHSGPDASRVYLVTSFDNWAPDPMRRQLDGVWVLHRMV
jgi:hypothetical protein